MDRTSHVVQQQLAAMGAVTYEVGLFKPSAAGEGRAVMIPRTWDHNTLMRSIPWLRLQNADGRNIYVRPKGEHDLSLVDDLTAEAVQRMRATGFTPTAVVETSPGNFQAWLKHPRQLPREISTMAARKLAEEFGGDRGAADWRHFGRLSGFTNRKEKYMSESGLFPFVRLIEASGVSYAKGEQLVSVIVAEHDRDSAARDYRRNVSNFGARVGSKCIDEFRSNPKYSGDETRVDLAFAIYSLSQGASDEQVASVIQNRDLSHKGDEKRQAEYVQRTISKALKMAESKLIR